MLPLLLVLGLSAACCGERLALFALDVNALHPKPESTLAAEPSTHTRQKRQSTVAYQVNHFEVQDQESHEARAATPAVALQPGYGPRGARQLSPKFPTASLQTQQRAPADYLDYGSQQYATGPDALQQQYFGSLAQFAAEQQAGGVPAQEPTQPPPPTTTLSPEVREMIRLQQEYKDRPILEQERLALGVRRPPTNPPPGQRNFGSDPSIQFVSAGGQPLVQPSGSFANLQDQQPQFAQYQQPQFSQYQPQFAQYDQVDATGSDPQYYPAPAPRDGPSRPLFTSAENSGKSPFTKRLVPKDFQPGKSLLDPTQSFSYTQLQFGDSSANDKYLYDSKLQNLRQKLVPQSEQHVAQRSAPKQRPKYEPSYVYDAAAYQIESSTLNSLPHYVASTPKAHYVSQYYHPTARPGLVYTQSSGDSGLVHPAKIESSTTKPLLRVQQQYVATTPAYYYESTPNPVQYEAPKHHKAKLQKLIAPDFVTAEGQQQLRQLQRLQQLQQAQQAQQAQQQQGQNYEAQGIEFDQDIYASLYSQPTKGYYANIKKSAVYTPTPAPGHAHATPSPTPAYATPSYAHAPSKSAYFVSTALPLAVRESTLSGQEDYQAYKNNELSDLSVQTPDGRKPLTPAEIKALVNAGFHIPELKQQEPAPVPVRRPVYSYQPVALPETRTPTTETPGYVTRVSPTYTPVYSTASPYDDVDSSPRSTEPRYRSTVSHLTARKRVTVAATPATLSVDEEKLGLPRDGVRHYYRVDASDSGTAPQAYVLVGGHVRAPVQGSSSKGLSQYSSVLVTRSAEDGKKTEKTR